MTKTNQARPASPRQIELIQKLIAERGPAAEPLAEQMRDKWRRGTFDWPTASGFIDQLLALPRADRAQAEPGYYTRGDDFYVVVRNRARTKTYAKRLVQDPATGRFGWEYAPGVGATLADLTPMTVAQAAEFGHLHGVCIRGFEPLTNPVSVIVGYGEICASREGWPYPHSAAEKRAVLAAGRYERGA